MLGKTAGGIFWMCRYLERSENMARLIEAGLRIALTRSTRSADEWRSVISTAGQVDAFEERHGDYNAANVVDWLLRDKRNSNCILEIITHARNNARLTRTAITREVWESTNECWLELSEQLRRPVRETELPDVLAAIKRQSALVRGALHGTMLRNEIFDFARLGTFLERADNTARILDVKYFVLLPSVSFVGSSLDTVQWDNILRSVSAQRAYRWLYPGDVRPIQIADFMLLDRRFPRSLAFCCSKVLDNLQYLTDDYGSAPPSRDHAEALVKRLSGQSVETIFNNGLHEFITGFLRDNARLAIQIERDFRFYE